MKPMIRFLSLLLIAAAAASTVPVGMALFGSGRVSIPLAIMAHAAGTLCIAAGFSLRSEPAGPARHADKAGGRGRRGNIGWLSALMGSALAPAYGIWSVIAVAAIQGRMRRRLPSIVSDEITVPGEEVFSAPLVRTKQLEVLERLDIEPFADIFCRGESALKKSAIHFLSATPSRQSVDMLTMALMDEDVEVRLYAAGVIGVIDDYFQKEIDRCRGLLVAQPGNAALAIDLSETYRSYAESGLIDEVSRTYYYREAIRVLAGLPRDADVHYRFASALFALELYGEAEEHIDRCLEAEPADASFQLLRCRILFALRRYDEVAEAMQRMRHEGLLPEGDPLAQYWMQHE